MVEDYPLLTIAPPVLAIALLCCVALIGEAALADRIAIVTGAGRPGNIGLAVCEAFLREGATGLTADGIVGPRTGALLDLADEIRAFIKAHEAELKSK